MMRRVLGGAAVFALIVAAAPALADEGWRVEAFAGYYVPDEADEDVSYGARIEWDGGSGWGIMGAYETFESQGGGFGESSGIEAEYQHLELSYVARPWGNGFEILSGIGATTTDVDFEIQGAVLDLDDTTLSVHVGLGYRADLGDVFYLRPEVRVRTYEIENQVVDFTASLALGVRFGGN